MLASMEAILSPITAPNTQTGSCNAVKATSVIDSVFVARPESGKKEGEERKKLMYYWPKDEPIDRQIQNIGFAEAIAKFTDSFAADDQEEDSDGRNVAGEKCSISNDEEEEDNMDWRAFREVCTEKQIQVYFEVERGQFLIGMAVSREKADRHAYILHAAALKNILFTAYRVFRLFFGTLTAVFKRDKDASELKTRLGNFFTRYLNTLRAQLMPLLDVYTGVEYMSLDNVNFLKMETLISQVLERFPPLLTDSKVMFLYQDRLLWHTVPKRDLIPLFRYLTLNLLPMSLRAELQPQIRSPSLSSSHQGKFITGPLRSLNEKEATNLPVVHLTESTNQRPLTPHNLIVYRALNATICLFVPVFASNNNSNTDKAKEDENAGTTLENTDLDTDFFGELDAFLGPKLTALASAIGDSFAVQTSAIGAPLVFRKEPDNVHFVYFNRSNLSAKSTFADSHDAKLPPVPVALFRLACDLSEDLENRRKEGKSGDILVKSDNDWWLAVKAANHRLLYLFFPQRPAAGLSDVHDEVKRIVRTHFDGIFFVE